MNWAKIINDLRNKMLVSQYELAKFLNVSYATINRWENGRTLPTFKGQRAINNLCMKNGIDINEERYKDNL